MNHKQISYFAKMGTVTGYQGLAAVLLLAGLLTGYRASAASCVPAPSGLAGWWPGDGNALNFFGTNNGALQGSATATNVGMVGQTFTFNGTSAYVQIPDSPALRPTNLTIEAWVRFNSLDSTSLGGSPAGDQYIVFKQNSRSSYFEGFDLSKTRTGSGDVFRFLVTSSAGVEAEIHSGTVLTTGVWYHVAAVRGSNFLQLYVNGTLERQTNVSFAQNYGTLPMFFGSSGQSYWDHKLSGSLDEVSLYNRALSGGEIAAIYGAGSAGKCKSASSLGITTQPQSQTVVAGSNVLFTVVASGTPPFGYQWRFNGSAIAASTGSALSLIAAQPTDAGNYTVVITNASAAITSAVAVLTVLTPPTITTQPQSVAVTAGATAAFTGAASGSAPLNFQWQRNGANLSNNARISGATTGLLTISNVVAGDAGTYTLVASNAAGVATSLGATLTVNGPPVITGQPASQTIVAGANAGMTVIVSGTAPLTYQWQRSGTNLVDGDNLFGATSSALSLTNAQIVDSGSYQVIITNIAGAATSTVAILTVNPPPVPPNITGQPGSQTVLAGSNVTFSVTADGTAPLSYQWRKNGAALGNGGNVSGATSSTLTLANVGTSDAASYQVVITNTAGSATSVVAVLTVNQAPAITSQPANQTVVVGTNASFSVTATGTAPFAYQWRFNGVDLAEGGQFAGATSSTLSISSPQTNNAGGYSVVITNLVGSVTSVIASLTVNPPPVPPNITVQPGSQTVLAGSNVTFSVTADGTSPLSYQWRKNGTSLSNGGNVSGATSSALTLANVGISDAANYQVIITNTAGSATSVVAVLTVNQAPTITSQPANQTVVVGTNASFSVTATGTAPLAYQWRFNGANLAEGGQFAGATTATLSISSPQTNNAGGYSVAISNVAGSVTSVIASLTVNAAGNCVPPGTGMISWWPGDGDANDIAGINPGTLLGGATASTAGKVGTAFNFDGTNGYVRIPDSAALRPANFTLEAWVRFDSLNSAASGGSPAGDQYIIFKQNSRTYNFEGIDLSKTRVTGGDVFRFLVTSASGQFAEMRSATFLTTGVWYHVAAVRGPSSIQLYVNGQLERQTNVAFAQDYGTLPLYFGTSGQTYWDHKFKGSLDEASFYNRPLSAAEIAAIYSVGAGGKCKTSTFPPTITTQPASQTLVVGGNVTFNVGASGTAPLGYRWLKDGSILANGGQISGATTSSLLLTSLQASDAGNYQAVVTNTAGSATSVVATLSSAAAPANDAFNAAQVISGSMGTATGNNFSATKQPGEPNHAGNAGGASVWYSWTAPSASPVTFDTTMSHLDTLLAVYTGTAVDALTLVASNDDISTNNPRSRLTFTPVAGTIYRVAVDGANGANGNLTLRWVQTSVALPDLSIVGSAANPRITTETFSSGSCAVMEGLIQAGTRRLIRFDTETENHGTADLFFGNPANNSLFVWAPCHAHYHFQNYMAYRLRDANGQIAARGLKVGFCILDVFRWDPNAPSAAKYSCSNQGIQQGWGDLYDSTLDGQWIDITGVPDGNYTIEMEANPQGIILESNYGNNVSTVPISIGNPTAPPLNNNFTSAQTLSGGFSSVPGTTANATKETGEPNHAGNVGGHSVWYQWTALSTKSVTIDTLGSSFNTLLGVYTGSSVNALSLVSSNDDIGAGSVQSRVTFPASSGTQYRIGVDGFNGAFGNLILTLNQTIQNDNFANCQFIGGPNGLAYGATAGASKETGEPNHAGNAGGQSIWYCWTAPISGSVTFNTVGSTFDTLLAVYTGSSLGSLIPVASNDDITPGVNKQSQVTFNAVGLTMYHVVIDGFNGDSGNTTLNWSLISGLADPAAIAGTTMNPDSSGRAILTHRFLDEGEFQLTVSGRPLERYRIERSEDLTNWKPLAATVADASGTAYFVDKSSMHLNQASGSDDPVCGPGQITAIMVTPHLSRFYRAVELGPSFR